MNKSSEEFQSFLKHARELLLVGGEPTVSPRFNKILDYVEMAGGAGICLITNGQNLKKKVLPRVNLFREVNVSIDAASANTYEKTPNDKKVACLILALGLANILWAAINSPKAYL